MKQHTSFIRWLHELVISLCSEIETRYLVDSKLKWKFFRLTTGASVARRRRRFPSTFTMRSTRPLPDSSVRTLTLRVGYSKAEAILKTSVVNLCAYLRHVNLIGV